MPRGTKRTKGAPANLSSEPETPRPVDDEAGQSAEHQPNNSGPATPPTTSRKRSLEDIDREIETLKRLRREAQAEAEETPSISRTPEAQVPLDSLARIISQSRNEDRSIPDFHGSVLDWPLFLKKFRDTTAKFNITEDANQKRLDKALRGKAREKVKDMLQHACFVGQIIEDLDSVYGGKDNISLAAMEAVEEIKPLALDLANIANFTLEVTKIYRMVGQCEMEGISQAILVKLLKLIPIRERTTWAAHQREIEKPQSGDLMDFVAWLAQTKKECMTNGIPGKAEKTRHRDNNVRTERRNGADTYQRRERHEPYSRRERHEPYSRRERYEPYSRREERGDKHRGYPRDTEWKGQPYGRSYAERGPRQERRQFTPPRILFAKPREHKAPTTQVPKIITDEKCVLGCSSVHEFQQCPSFKDLSQQERFNLIRQHRRCPYCCGSHRLSDCSEKKN